MSEVLLLNPSTASVYKKLKGPVFPSVGLLMLGTVLKEAGVKVKIVDFNIFSFDSEFFQDMLKDCVLAGITITTPTMKSGLELAEQLKKIKPGLKIVMGGVHVTLKPEDVMENQSVDYAVVGEGEFVLLKLTQAVLKGEEPEDIPGLWRRFRDGTYRAGPPREFIKDLDVLPTPDFTIIENRAYGYPDSLVAPVLPLVTSRGCPGCCSFCNAIDLWGKKLRMRSARRLIEDLQVMESNYGVREVHIWDDNFITNHQRVREIVSLLKEKGLKLKFSFPNGVRVDYINEEIISLLREMGTYSIAVGVESGSQKILNEMSKGVTLEKIRAVFKLLKRSDLEIWAFFLFGMPGETVETIRETIKFALELDPNIAKFHILKPYPGTRVAKDLLERSFILNTNYEDYGTHLAPVHRTIELEPAQLEWWQRVAYKQFFFRPKKLCAELFRLCKSWHRVKTNIPVALRLLASKIG